MVAAGGLYSTSAGTAAGSSAAMSGASMFGSMVSTAMPYIAIASMIYSGFEAAEAKREQLHQQYKLAKQQEKQQNLIYEKIKADNANLYSAARSAVAQTTGAMGAVY